ncbi:hypothetical protein LP416_15420 [Polaromonas sp. P2-4]|nr:hypothetical protein LP416_15420 [Polaromonas sp. P2-4]
MKSLSNWRSVRVLESRLERELRQRHSLGLHGLCIGFFTLGLMWGVSHLQMVMGVDSLALRYLVTLGAGNLGYLAVLHWWMSAAVRLTWKPLLGAIACAVALGATMDHFVPAANSLPQAIKLVRAQLH